MITTVIEDFSVTPQLNSPSFPEDIDVYNAELPSRIAQINEVGSEMNQTASDINSLSATVSLKAIQVEQKAVEASASATSASSSATIANSAKEAILGYVVPTTATYTIADINNLVSSAFDYSGYTHVSTKEDNFVFKTSSSFLNKVADKAKFIKFGDKVVDTNVDVFKGYNNLVGGGGGLINLSSGKVNLYTTVADSSIYVAVTDGISSLKTYYIEFDFEHISGVQQIKLYGAQEVTSTDITNGKKVFIYKPDYNVSSLSIGLASSTASIKNANIYNIVVSEIQVCTHSVPNVTEALIMPIVPTFTNQSAWTHNNTYFQDNKLKFNSNSGDAYLGYFGTTPNDGLEVGVPYKLEMSVTITSGSLEVRPDFSTIATITTSGSYTYYFTLVDDAGIDFQGNLVGGQLYISIDTMVLTKLVVSTVTSVQVNEGDYVVTPSTVFRAKQTTPIGTAFTNTTYFDDRTNKGVINMYLDAHKDDDGVYVGKSSELLLSDVSDTDLLNNPVWLARNGYINLSQNLYVKGDSKYVISEVFHSLNKGFYHPTLNPYGTKKASDNKFYNDTTISFTTVSDCFNTSKLLTVSGYIASGVSGRDDGKYYDICYSDLVYDVREYAGDNNDTTLGNLITEELI